MQKILFPTDFSDAANHAFIYALHLTQKIGASITTLYAYEPPEIRGAVMPNTLGEIYESIKMETFEEYQQSIEKLRKIAKDNQFDGLPMQHLLKEGRTIDVIVKIAQTEGYDLIVMGTKGASGLKEAFVGTNTGEVMEKAYCPVLAIPDEAVFDNNIDRLAIASEFTEEDEKALIEVLKFASLFNAEVHCLHVKTNHSKTDAKHLERMREKFADHTKLRFEVIKSNDIFQTLNSYLEEEKIDALAMLTHRRNFFQELFNYSRAKKMIYHSKVPVLAIQAHILQ